MFDPRQDVPSEVVVHSVAAVVDREPVELEPLYSRIDPEALDRVFHSLAFGTHEGDARVIFRFEGYDVMLNSYGVIELEPVSGELSRR